MKLMTNGSIMRWISKY